MYKLSVIDDEKRRRLARLGVALALVVSTGCGAEATVDGGLSCDNTQLDMTCVDYEGFTADEASATCDGTFRESACDRSDAVGTCSISIDGQRLVVVYSSADWTAMTAQDNCTGKNGEWAATN